MKFHIAILKSRSTPIIGEVVYDQDLWEHHNILFPCKVLEILNNGNIIVEELNEDDAIPCYLEKIRELEYWWIEMT